MKFEIAVLPGDGIGPEVISEAVKVLEAVGKKFGHSFNLTTGWWAVPPSMPRARRCPTTR